MLLRMTIGLFVLLSVNNDLYSQVLPENNASLSHTQVLFEYPDFFGGAKTRLKVYYNSLKDEGSIAPVIDTVHQTNAILISNGLSFGESYKWKYIVYGNDNTVLYESAFYFFETVKNHLTDHNFFRIRTYEKNDKKTLFKGLLFLDGLKIAIDNQGKAKWFMNYDTTQTPAQCIRLTPDGTITSLVSDHAIETNLDGIVVWKSPDIEETNGIGFPHHEFFKLSNGHFITSAYRVIKSDNPEQATQNIDAVPQLNDPSQKSPVIVEFDADGRIVWTFDLLKEINPEPANGKNKLKPSRVGHMNGMVMDETNHKLYVSCKNFNNILVIDRKTNKILYMLGNQALSFNDSTISSPLFRAQHNPILLKNGHLMLFNNNIKGEPSSIAEFDLSKKVADPAEQKIWEYSFKNAFQTDFHSNRLGSVQEMKNGNILVGAGTVNRVFEVSKDKELKWAITTEINRNYFTGNAPSWDPAENYRVWNVSSLYPYYFTLQSIFKNNHAGASQALSFILNNVGTENDEYEISGLLNEKKTDSFKTFKTTIQAAKSIPIPLTLKLKQGDVLLITVKSMTSNKTRTIQYDSK
jgi:hypothetical protein